MKKSWKRILAVAAVLVLALCVLSGCSDDTQAKIDAAVKTATETLTKEKDEALKAAQEAADTVKADLEGQVKDLTEKLAAAEETAKTAADDAVKAATEAADAAKTDLEGQVKDLTEKLAAAEETAKTAAENATKAATEAADAVKADLEGQVKDLTEKLAAAEETAKTTAEAAAKEKDEAVAAATKAGDDAKTELEGKVADLTKELEEVKAAATEGADAAAKAATEAADAARAELEGQVKELTEKLAAAEETAKTAAEAAAKEKDEAVAAAVKAGEDAKAELESKVAELENQIADAAAAAEAEVAEVVEQVEEKVEEAAAEAPAAEAPAAEEPAAEAPAAEAPAAEEAAVLSHADYIAAELDTEVTVETYVQATQSWWDNKITIYAQSEDGAYFIYNATCTEEDAAKLVPGAKIRVKGFKSEWAGEVEITDATFELLEGDPFIAEPADVTALLGQDDLIAHQNEKVLFKGLTVAAQDDGAAFNYKNAENKTDDLYVRFTKDDLTLNLCVEFYLCGNDTDVYKAVEGLQVGDVVDVEGFLYWYEGNNTHMTAVTKAE